MQGPITEDGLIDFDQRGLIPRTFEYLFECIRSESQYESEQGHDSREFLCKCTYVEIYNETIFDLLDINSTTSTCTLREDIKKGVYIEGAKEEVINSPSEAYEVYERGSLNRHVAETSMNRESSRSHSVFTLFIQSKQRVGEIIDVRESRFNLVDLAGSERQQMTGTTGQRLKEAGNINKSLLALSNVINGLVDISHGRPRHVQYRDSKLTFLLRDSLGGNAKTVIIANVSPATLYYNETLSTLKFAQRAKMIKNKAVVNKDIQGNVLQLQAEIQRLQHELYMARHQSHSMTMKVEDTSDQIKKPRLINNGSKNNISDSGDELDPAEAYLMLTMALERQAEANDEIESYKSKLHLLEELVQRKESQNQSIRMILKFRENSLKTGTSTSLESSSSEENQMFTDLKKEINELRKIIEHHPEVTRFAYENLQLREKLYKYEALEKRLADFENSISRHKQYEQMLTNRLLVLEKIKSGNSNLNNNDRIENNNIDRIDNDNDRIENNNNVRIDSSNELMSLSSDESINMQRIGTISNCNFNKSNENNCYENETFIILENELKKEREISNILSEENVNLKTENEVIKRENDNLKTENGVIKRENDNLKTENNNLKAEFNSIEVEISNNLKENEKMISSKDEIILNINNYLKKGQEQIIEFENEIKILKQELCDQESDRTNISGVLEMERQSSSQLMQEREELQVKLDLALRNLDREREQSKLLLQDYEQAKNDFNAKVDNLAGEVENSKGELESSLQKVKTIQADKNLIQQELEVTRQILAEYKSRDQNISVTHVQAAEVAGKRIAELESEINRLQEQVTQLEGTAGMVTSLSDRNKILQSENGQLHGKIGKLEFLMRSAQSDNDELMAQVTQLQRHLETSLSSNSNDSTNTNTNANAKDNTNPNALLQSQLEAANHTISSMKRQLSALEQEISNLKGENEKLTQHQNLKQKLQYHVKIKQENNELQEELMRCKEELIGFKGKQETLMKVLQELKKETSTVAVSNSNSTANAYQLNYEKIVGLIKSLTI